MELDEIQDKETKRVEEEMAEWAEFYNKFKPRLDELASYEERVHELEAELDEKERIVKMNFEREKYKFAFLTGSYLLATWIFVRIISSIQNPWVFFGAGILVGVGFAFLLRFWINIV